jgi:hypothetical protein
LLFIIIKKNCIPGVALTSYLHKTCQREALSVATAIIELHYQSKADVLYVTKTVILVGQKNPYRKPPI